MHMYTKHMNSVAGAAIQATIRTLTQFLALLCVTAQQSYCRRTSVQNGSSIRTYLSTNVQIFFLVFNIF